ncbi:MAG: DNA mismatch repair endonuclease MutL [Parasporobacterium sp.]|nr:DNA mismatch repair endonuclease MutL [Parasporobacterium sp.]
MNNEIHVLDKNTIDKIAAGEVVERPSSVVKELMENAIDAGASALSVEIRDGGISLIRVTDNGCGIDQSQIKKAFLRHSTSKISSAQDLSFIRTLGFRGEALSSISAVSRMELCTKTKDSLTGCIYKVEGGEEISFQEAGLPDGTTVIVRDLFYNTPARLKFLKSPQTEAGYVSAIVEKIALSHPDISVKYMVGGSLKLNTRGSGSLKDTVYGVFGRDITNSLIEVHSKDELLQIDGFIGEPSVARSSRNLETYFINGRYVKDKVIAAAIEEAYKGRQMKGTFPFTDLYISIEPELMDVNVHPSKMEIRFFDNQKVFQSLSALLKYALAEKERIPVIKTDTEQEKKQGTSEKPKTKETAAEPFETQRQEAEQELKPLPDDKKPGFDFREKENPSLSVSTFNEETLKQLSGLGKEPSRPEHVKKDYDFDAFSSSTEVLSDNNLNAEKEESKKQVEPSYEQTSFFEEGFLTEKARPSHRVIGEIFDTYWIVEFQNEMFIIDQHAAHEKVLYEKFINELRSGTHYSQNISPALIVTLNPKEEETLEKIKDLLKTIGFTVEHFGGKEYALSSVPTDLYSLNDRQLFLSFLDEAGDIRGSLSSEILEDRIATAACKAAVKGENRLSFAEANALIDQLLSLENPYNCPHGRPTIIKMSKHELEKSFKRII